MIILNNKVTLIVIFITLVIGFGGVFSLIRMNEDRILKQFLDGELVEGKKTRAQTDIEVERLHQVHAEEGQHHAK